MDLTPASPNFCNLPPEIQLMILEFNPQMAAIYSCLSWSTYNLTWSMYLKSLGSQFPTLSEIQKYIRSHPTKLGMFSLHLPNANIYTSVGDGIYFWHECGMHNVLSCWGYDEQITREYTSQFGPVYFLGYNASVAEDTFDDQCSVAHVLQEAETDSHTRAPLKSHHCGVSVESLLSEFSEDLLDFQLDLKSSFRMFTNRIGCVSREPDYAKRMVLQRLNRVYKRHRKSTSLISLVAVHAFLCFQARVLNIANPQPDNFGFEGEVFLEDGTVVGNTDPDSDQPEYMATIQLQTLRRELVSMYYELKATIDRW